MRGPYRKGVRRRQEIVDAATEVFGRRGYHGGSLRSIAERVGVSSASLVQYFGTKEGLLAAVLQEWQLQSRPAGADGLRGLAWVESMRDAMVYNVGHRGLLELFLTLTVEATSPEHPARSFVQERYAAIVPGFAGHLREAVEDGEVAPMTASDAEQEARLFFATMDGIELQWLLDPDVDLLALFDRLLTQSLARWRTGVVPPTGAASA